MPNHPTPAELGAWLKIPADTITAKTAELTLCLEAAIDDLTERCNLPAAWNRKVKLACLMQAARYWKRKDSPEGVAGFGDLGPIRVMSFDPDVERMVGRYLKFEFA